MAVLQITCLGNCQITLDGTAPNTAFTEKARALLIYLALESQVHQRSNLTKILWSGYGEESARNSLRQALHLLRQSLPEGETPWLLVTRQTVQINPAASISVDVTAFIGLLVAVTTHAHVDLATCATCLAHLRQAIDLYRGDFLAGLGAIDSDGFEEWRRITQEQLHIQMLDALARLAHAAESGGDTECALHAARRQLTMEPWLETAHRQIMRLLAQHGQRTAALAQYQRCRQVLAEELSVEPDEETIALYEQIRSGAFDKGARRQGDKVTSDTVNQDHPVRLSSRRSLTQSPRSAELTPKPHPAPPSSALPRFSIPLVGRAEALAEIDFHLQRPEARLVTLLGPGGMGKTRLAVEVGRNLSVRFRDGVWFVPLAAISTPDALPGAIAGALGIVLQGSDPRSVLLQTLRQQQLLLILDNFEQLLAADVGASLGAVDLVVDLLAAAPAVQILVTSRERLKLRDEQVYSVPALTFAPNATLAEAASSSAVRLFVQAMRRVCEDFELTAANLTVILRICQLVQGMPLGLELAAANAGSAPLTAIADELAQSTEFLAVEWRDLPPRQRSMRAVFAWSWRLLTAAEQHILRQSATFRGGFTYSAAQAVTGATIPLLTHLTDKSLLQWQATTTGEGSYFIHELLRQFAAEELAAAGEEEAVATRHSEYYLALLAAQQQSLLYHAPRQAIHALRAELDNIRQAWRWGAGHLSAPLVEQSAVTLREFCLLTGLITEGVELFTLAAQARRRHLFECQPLAATGKRQTEERLYSILLGLLGNILIMAGRHEEALQQATAALQFATDDVNPEGMALAYLTQGQALRRQGKSEQARQLLTQVVQLGQAAHNHANNPTLLLDLERRAYSWLTSIALSSDDYPLARAYIARQLDICRRLQKFAGEAMALTDLVDIEITLGDYALAQQYAEQALTAARKTDFRWAEAACLGHLADIARCQGNYTQAQTLYEQVLTLYHEMGHLLAEAVTLDKLGLLYLQFGDVDRAHMRIGQTFHLLRILDMPARETCAATLARAWLNYLSDKPEAALVDAEQGWQMARQLDGGASQASALILVGLIRERLQQAGEATTAYQQALTTYLALGHHHQTVEPRAGLARLALAAGDFARANAEVEAILPILIEQPRAGYNTPFFVYLTAYRVLAANRDQRAATLLQQGYHLLQQDAAQLDEESRQRFLTAVPLHRGLVTAYAEMQAQRDRETRDTRHETRRQEDKKIEGTQQDIADRKQRTEDNLVSPVSPSRVSLSPVYDWAEMPVVDFPVERRAEVAQLTAWLTPGAPSVPAQLISILGMGGMGKTTLTAAVTKAVAPNFAVVIWRSLLNAPPLAELLRNWLQILSRQTLAALPESLDEQLRLLLTYLQQERCLLVLDNVESIFAADTPAPAGSAQAQSRAGVARSGYEGYDQLFQRVASSDHQSCLLLTSREQPYALLRVPSGRGRQAQTTGRVQVLPLIGLDQTAGQMLLASNGLHASAAEAAQLVENYSGNPLALQIVAATIVDFFGGDVVAFQQEEGQIFDGIRLVLDQQFARLSPLERDILVWLAIEREAISVSTLRANFVQALPTGEVLEALQALQNRSLLEKHPAGLTLQNVIIEYTTEYLVEQVCQEILDTKVRLRRELTSEPHPVTLSFLNRFALLKAQAKEYVRHSQSRLIVQPVVARLLDRLGQNRVEQTLRALIGELRQQPQPTRRGYAAGNLLNLLLQAGCALNELDLSHQAVWQAYLRECTLHNVNFSGADLRGAEFADTFTAITTLTYSRNGKFLAAGTSLGDIRIWLAQTLQPIALLQGHSRLVMGLAFGSAQGQLLASGGEDGALRLWNMAKLEEPSVILYQASGFIRTVAVSPIADLVASAGDEPDIQIWDMASRRAVAILRGHSNIVTAVVFSADGRYLASCSGDQTVRLWDLSAIEQSVSNQRAAPQPPVIEESRVVYTWSPAAADVWQIAISPDNQWLAGVTLDGMVWRWQIDAALTAKPLQVLQAQGAHQMALTFSPDNAQLAVGALSGAIWLLDSRSGEIVRQIEGHKPLTLTLTFAPDGKTLASSGSDRTLRVWELPTGRSIQALAGMARAFRAAVFGADGKTIVTSAEDQTIRIWDVNESPSGETTMPHITGGCRHVLRGHSSGIWTVAIDHTCAVAASAGEDSTILLWDRHSGQQIHKFAGHLDTVTALAFSPDGRTLISASPDQTVRLWNYRTFTPLAQLRDDSPSISTHEKSIWSVALSPDGALLAAGYSDGGIVIWNIRDPQHCQQVGKLHKHEGWVRTLAFSPDGSLLASGSNDQTVRLWAVKTGSLQHILHGHSDWVMSVAFHPHGNLLASGSFDSTIRLWNVTTGQPIAVPATTPMRHDKGVVAVTFHPAGHLLLSASRDERMTFWHCATQQRLHNLVAPGPYSGLKIAGATGLSAAQKVALRALGAVDEVEDDKVTSDKET